MSTDIDVIRKTRKGYEVCTMKRRIMSGPNQMFDPSTGEMVGTEEMSMAITYNYAEYYYDKHALGKDGLRWLNGKNCKKTIPRLIKTIEWLSKQDDGPAIEEARKKWDDLQKKCTDDNKLLKELYGGRQFKIDYWTPMPSNVQRAFTDLLHLAVVAPKNAVWRVLA